MTREHPEKHVAKGLTLEGPAAYQIRIKGSLEEYWSERLGGMRLTTSKQEEHVLVTELTGLLIDQAALLGVLNTLYDLHMPILSVTCLETPAPDRDGHVI
ncbi:MAG: hypothetical protein GY801_45045 [bacterium]|nr:hypothetical protein [bacterium]